MCGALTLEMDGLVRQQKSIVLFLFLHVVPAEHQPGSGIDNRMAQVKLKKTLNYQPLKCEVIIPLYFHTFLLCVC